MAGVEAARTFSIEYDLDKPAKKRSVEKLDMIEKDAKDPYCVAENLSSQADLTELTEVLPLVEFGDLYHYLITAPSPVTKEELKAWKSMDGRRYLLSGWVGNVTAYRATADGQKVVVKARVRHSQVVSWSYR